MEPVLKFTGPAEVKDGIITAILSTEAVDRDGDIVRLSGWRLDDLDGLPLMSCHDYGSLTKQIGEWRNIRRDPQRKALVGEPVYYTDCGNPEADYAYQIALKGRARYSVGFLPHQDAPRKGAAGREYTDQELLEASQVPIPSNREAVQLAVKAFRQRWGEGRDATEQPLRKWASNQMNPSADGWGAPADIHCIVRGCDDAAQATLPICSEHLYYLMCAPAEPPGAPPDDDAPLLRALRVVQRVSKAGRTISAANMGKLHSALAALHDVHDASCTDDDCPFDATDDGDDAPPAQRDKALGESSGAAGGVTVSEGGTHGAFDGRHSHPHDAAGHTSSADEDGLHDHAHTHSDDGDHGHGHPDSTNFKTLRDKAVHRIEQMSTSSINSLPDSAFAVVSSGGTKDASGKTVPRDLRHLPHHQADGSIDLPHLRNALARVSQTDLSAADKAKAEAHLDAHAKAEKIGDYADDKAFDLGVFEDAVSKAMEAVQW
ncbi:MAG TPA: hypothetical protein VFA70_04255 [Dehalococcoidia bacterium]|nr:hypothetical protein [Dehalococcoidia bacterium]